MMDGMPILKIELSGMRSVMSHAIQEQRENILAEAQRQVETMVTDEGFMKVMVSAVRQELDALIREQARTIVRRVMDKKTEALEVAVTEHLTALLREDGVQNVMER
jgi:hypothetical protein